MESTVPIEDSDNESDPDVLELNADTDLGLNEEDCLPDYSKHKIGSAWRDIVVGEQMEGCLTGLKVTSKKPNYIDVDDPNYALMNKGCKRKRNFVSYKPIQNTDNVLEKNFDIESNHVLKKKCLHGNGNFNKYNANSKCRILPNISDSEEKTFDQFLNELCTNLHEYNKDLMLSVISKIDRKTILEKYNKTCLIESNGGQMIKNGDRRRTSGGIFFNLIKEDKSIPNSAKKSLFGSSQNDEIKKKKKKERMKQKKERLKKIALKNKEEAGILNKLNEELAIIASTSARKDEESQFQLSDATATNDV